MEREVQLLRGEVTALRHLTLLLLFLHVFNAPRFRTLTAERGILRILNQLVPPENLSETEVEGFTSCLRDIRGGFNIGFTDRSNGSARRRPAAES